MHETKEQLQNQFFCLAMRCEEFLMILEKKKTKKKRRKSDENGFFDFYKNIYFQKI